MTERKKLTARPGRSDGRKDVEIAKRAVRGSDSLKRVIYDTDPKTHQKLSAMRVMSRDNVPVRAFVDEAVNDLFEKYLRGEGHYKVRDLERILGD